MIFPDEIWRIIKSYQLGNSYWKKKIAKTFPYIECYKCHKYYLSTSKIVVMHLPVKFELHREIYAGISHKACVELSYTKEPVSNYHRGTRYEHVYQVKFLN